MAAGHVNIATKLLSIHVFFFCAVWPAVLEGRKERLDHGVYLELTDMILNLEKRVKSQNLFDQHKSLSSPVKNNDPKLTTSLGLGDNLPKTQKRSDTCSKEVTEGNIIRAKDSIANGAKFLDSFKGTDTNEQCQDFCCKNTSCDVAIYQDKENRYCYLFQCNGNCLYRDHDGYLVNHVTHAIAASSDDKSGGGDDSEDISGNENDLENLSGGTHGSDAEGHGNSGDVSGEKPNSDSVEDEPQMPLISQHSVSLSGYCTQDNQCEDTNAECSKNNCKCRSGFYNKEGLCRTTCPSSKFECFELGTISRGPECVPKAQVCDSYMQCADGSDEFNCEADFPSVPMRGKPKAGNKELGQSSITKSGVESSQPTAIALNKPSADPTKDIRPDLHPSVNSNRFDKTKSSSPKPSSDDRSSTTTQRSVVTNNPSPSNSFATGNGGAKHLFVASREKVIIASPGGGNAEGPIVALSLGLALTLVLLVMVACRLRGFKHRLSKGRPLNQNEADYLINGMYL